MVRGSATYVLQDVITANTGSAPDDYVRQVERSLPAGGVITSVVPWHVPGSQNAVRVRPIKVNPETGNTVGLARYGGENFITAEPDREPLPASEPCYTDDVIALDVINTDGSNDYRVSYYVVVDHSDDPDAIDTVDDAVGAVGRIIGGGR